MMRSYIEKNGEFPTLEDLHNLYNSKGTRPHAFVATIVDCIVQKWGFDAVLALLEDYSRFEEILGQTQSDFREGWIEFLKETYL